MHCATTTGIAIKCRADEAPKAAQIKQALRDMRERTCYRALKWLREQGFVKQGLLGSRYLVTDEGRDKLEQTGDDPDTAAALLLDEEYFQVNTALPLHDPDPTPPDGARVSQRMSVRILFRISFR